MSWEGCRRLVGRARLQKAAGPRTPFREAVLVADAGLCPKAPSAALPRTEESPRTVPMVPRAPGELLSRKDGAAPSVAIPSVVAPAPQHEKQTDNQTAQDHDPSNYNS